MAKERNLSVPAAYIILQKEGKVLMARRKNTGYYDGWVGFPAGHVDAKELPLTAGIREAKEEIGVDIDEKDIQFAHALYRTAHDETGDRVDYFFVAKKWKGEPNIMEPDKCDDLQWFPMDQLPENMIHHEKQAFNNFLKGIGYSEVNAKDTHHNPSR